jgi:DNA-binding PadR family transcriptional regulator
MARSAQTELAVLGALSVDPMTGYAIREAIRDVLGHFWSESFGQIYPTLSALESRGLVQRQAGTTSRASSVFEITDAGRDQLVNLLRQPVQSTPPRNGLLLRLFFGRALGVDACRDLLLTAQAEAQNLMAEYDQIRAEIQQDDEHAADRPYWLLTVSAGEHTARAALLWTQQALSELAAVEQEKGGSSHR